MRVAGVAFAAFSALLLAAAGTSRIVFVNVADKANIRFVLENNPTAKKYMIETMAGGVAVFDYNGDGRPDIFFTNGADLSALKKSSAKYSNRLFRNDGNGVFTDVTQQAGLAGTGFDIGVAAGDYDNDGHPDLFVTGVHG